MVRGTQCGINIHAHIQDEAEYSLGALPRPQPGATPLKFGPNQLEAGRQRGMRVLLLNYKCSFLGLMNHSPSLSSRKGVLSFHIFPALRCNSLTIEKNMYLCRHHNTNLGFYERTKLRKVSTLKM